MSKKKKVQEPSPFLSNSPQDDFSNYPKFNYKCVTSHASSQCPENEFLFVFMFQEKGGGSVFSGMFKKSPKLSEAPRLKEVKLYIPNVCKSNQCAVKCSLLLYLMFMDKYRCCIDDNVAC